jgi:hypothetical protein
VVVLVAKTFTFHLYRKLNFTNVQHFLEPRRFVYRTGTMTWFLAQSYASTTCVLSAWKSKNYARSCPIALGVTSTHVTVSPSSRTTTSAGNVTLPYATLRQMNALLFASHASNIFASNAGVTILAIVVSAECSVECKNYECKSFGVNSTCGSQDEIEEIDDDASVIGDGGEHP